MSKIRAKFQCNSVIENGYNKTANLHAVYGGSDENKAFAKATPCGNLNIVIDKDVEASNFFEQGKSYYLDFTPVD